MVKDLHYCSSHRVAIWSVSYAKKESFSHIIRRSRYGGDRVERAGGHPCGGDRHHWHHQTSQPSEIEIPPIRRPLPNNGLVDSHDVDRAPSSHRGVAAEATIDGDDILTGMIFAGKTARFDRASTRLHR